MDQKSSDLKNIPSCDYLNMSVADRTFHRRIMTTIHLSSFDPYAFSTKRCHTQEGSAKFVFGLIPPSTKFLDTQGILSIADSIRCATAKINITTNSSYHHPWKEEIIMSKQEKGDKKRFEVGFFVQVKGGAKPFGRISGENGKQRWLVRLVGADG
jgi:hypothetical protein